MSTKLLSPELEIDLHKEEEQDESIKKGERTEFLIQTHSIPFKQSKNLVRLVSLFI